MAAGLPDRTREGANMAARNMTPVLILHRTLRDSRMNRTDPNRISAIDADRLNITQILQTVLPATALVLPAENEATSELSAAHQMSELRNKT